MIFTKSDRNDKPGFFFIFQRREREHSPPATKQRSAKPNLRRENKGGEEEAERIGVLAKMEKVDFSSLEHWVSDSRRRHRGVRPFVLANLTPVRRTRQKIISVPPTSKKYKV